jgi:hypothetical protein
MCTACGSSGWCVAPKVGATCRADARQAEAGDALQLNKLGLCFLTGLSPYHVDERAAVLLFQRSAAQNNSQGLYNLGYVYQSGLGGLEQNYAKAIQLYRQSIAQGIAQGTSYSYPQNNLGYMYKNGLGLKQDYVEAARLYRLSASKGFALAQRNLGQMFADGLGVTTDQRSAFAWCVLATHPLVRMCSSLPNENHGRHLLGAYLPPTRSHVCARHFRMGTTVGICLVRTCHPPACTCVLATSEWEPRLAFAWCVLATHPLAHRVLADAPGGWESGPATPALADAPGSWESGPATPALPDQN